jgi:hypothetical protein
VILALLSLGDAYFLRNIKNAAIIANNIGPPIITGGAKKNLSIYCIWRSVCPNIWDLLHILRGPMMQTVLWVFLLGIRLRGCILDYRTKILPIQQNRLPGLHIL